jgi:hypothetical protein
MCAFIKLLPLGQWGGRGASSSFCPRFRIVLQQVQFIFSPTISSIYIQSNNNKFIDKSKTNADTGRGGPWGYDTSRIPYFLNNRLTDSGEVVSVTCRPRFTPRKILGYSFLYKAE